MQESRDHTESDTRMVEFLQTNYDDIDPNKPLYKVGLEQIYVKDLKNFVSANDAKSKEGCNLIVKKAINETKVDVLKNLMEYGYRLRVINDKGETAVHFAFRNEYKCLKQDKGKLLFSSADDFNYTDSSGLSHLHIACALGNTVVVKKYLNNNADINAKYNRDADEDLEPIYECEDFTPLHFAVKNHRYEVVKLLLEHGADVEAKDAEERTPLWLTALVREYEYPSCWENHLKIIEILIKYGSNINYKNESGSTALMNIFWNLIYYGYESLNQTEFDVESETFINNTIEIDCRKRQQEILEIFIKNGADVSLTTKYGHTLLHSILNNLKTERIPNRFEDISFDDIMQLEMIQLILATSSSQIDVCSKDSSEESPLSLAVSYMSLGIVKLLLNYTSDLSSIKVGPYFKKICYLNTVPTFECARNLIAIIELLMDKGYKITWKDNLTILKFLIHGIDECDCCNLLFPSDLGSVVNFYSSIHLPCIRSIEDKNRFDWDGENLDDLQLNLELMEYAKLFIDTDMKNEIQRLLRKFDVPLTRNLYHENRVKEIKQMKSMKMQDGLNLYDIMTKNPDNIYPYIQNRILDDKFFEEFDLYKLIIKGHFAKSLIRHYVETSADNYIQTSLFSLLPYLCCKRILFYLSNKDIYNLCFAIIKYDL